MKCATWNIRAGGGTRIPEISTVLLDELPDLIVLTEYRPQPGRRLLELLGEQYPHVVAGNPGGPHNSICVLSRSVIRRIEFPSAPQSIHRWESVECEQNGLVVLGVHLPNPREPWNREDFWDALHQFTRTYVGVPAMILGDLNAALNEDCEGKLTQESSHMIRLRDEGWTDAWRYLNPDLKEYTWYSHRQNGFRIDHCLVTSLVVPKLLSARYRHDVRANRISDHSLLVVEFN